MPTFAWLARSGADFDALSDDQQAAFLAAVELFVADLRAGAFRPSLRVKGVKGAAGVFEMTWAANGRATFEYGGEITSGETHIIWPRVGTHGVFRTPWLRRPWYVSEGAEAPDPEHLDGAPDDEERERRGPRRSPTCRRRSGR